MSKLPTYATIKKSLYTYLYKILKQGISHEFCLLVLVHQPPSLKMINNCATK
jgi:hypothetical protein